MCRGEETGLQSSGSLCSRVRPHAKFQPSSGRFPVQSGLASTPVSVFEISLFAIMCLFIVSDEQIWKSFNIFNCVLCRLQDD